MKILVSCELKSRKDSIIIEKLLTYINQLDDWEISFFRIGEDLDAVSDSSLLGIHNGKEVQNFDLILALNNSGLMKIIGFVRNSTKPLIYLIDDPYMNSDITVEQKFISKIVLLNSLETSIENIFVKGFIKSLRLARKVSLTPSLSYRKSDKPKILVDINNYKSRVSLLGQIISLLNSLIDFEITLICRSAFFPMVLNENIRIEKSSDFKSLNNNTDYDIVIGSGEGIENAINNGIPCIVLGEQGLGGILDEENFDSHYSSFFQGRIGGEVDEYIPIDILIDDIQILLGMDENSLTNLVWANYKLFQEKIDNEVIKFAEILSNEEACLKALNINLFKTRLIFPSTYKITPISSDNFIVVNCNSGFIHCRLGKEEKNIVELFKSGATIEEVSKLSGYEKQFNYLVEFIKDLLSEKLLINHELPQAIKN